MFNLILTILFVVLITFGFIIKYNKCNFIGEVQTLKTIEEQKKENDIFLKLYNEYTAEQKEKNKNEVPLTWNNNNTIESMKLTPCLADIKDSGRLTCYSAPLWWYPNDKYNPDNFRSIFYGDYYNPIYNYLGNAQEMYWDFKSVKN